MSAAGLLEAAGRGMGRPGLATWGLLRLPRLATLVSVVLLGVVVAVKFPVRPWRGVTADESPSQVKPLRRWLMALAALGSAARAATAGWLLLDVATQAQDPALALSMRCRLLRLSFLG